MTNFIYAAVPDDPRYLQALGAIAVRHGHLEYHLRMLVKTLAVVTVDDALHATSSMHVSAVRPLALKLARRRWGEGAALIRLRALLARCKIATEQRNELLHNMYALDREDGDDEEGTLVMRRRDLTFRALPPVEEVEQLVATLNALNVEVTDARQSGFISQAMTGAKGA